MVKNPEKSVAQILLDAPSQLQPLMDKAQQIIALDSLVKQYLASNLQSYCRVINFRVGTLVIGADNASIATHLKFTSQHLLSELRKHPEFSGIRSIQVVVERTTHHKKHDHAHHKAHLSNATSLFLLQQSQQCQDPRMAKILRCLASHTYKSDDHNKS